MPRSASYSVDFSKRECSGSGSLLLENVATLRYGSKRAINLVNLYPGIAARLDALGAATITYVGPVAVEKSEILTISGGTRAGLSVPRRWVDPCGGGGLPSSPWSGHSTLGAGGGANIQTVWAVDAESGSNTTPGMSFDSETNEIVADSEVYGSFRVSYTAGAHRYSIGRSGDAAYREETLHAFYRGAFAQLSLPGLRGLDYIAVYYVTSDYVADSNGSWELPDDWPDDNTYADAPGADPLPDDSSYQQLRRNHEIAIINELGDLQIEQYTVEVLQPFVTLGDYRRAYAFRQQPSPDMSSPYYEAWQEIDFTDLFNSASQRFEGLVPV